MKINPSNKPTKSLKTNERINCIPNFFEILKMIDWKSFGKSLNERKGSTQKN